MYFSIKLLYIMLELVCDFHGFCRGGFKGMPPPSGKKPPPDRLKAVSGIH